MKKVLVYFFLFTLPVFTVAQNSLVITKTMRSDILNAEKEYTVYLPPGYDSSDKRYPVLYLLHGAWGNSRSWIEQGNLKEITDKSISASEALPMIIIMPDARGVAEDGGGKRMGYFNVTDWKYEDYFFEELIPYIDKNYKTVANKTNRSVAGLSMGGGGAIAYAQRHPLVFSSAVSLSGCVGYCSSENARKIDVEFDMSLARTDPTHFVQNSTDKQITELKTVRWYVDCGDDDYLYDGNIALYKAMKAKGIPLEYRMRNGGHTWSYWQEALPSVLSFCSITFFNEIMGVHVLK